MSIETGLTPKLFLVTSELPCPYLPNRFERKLLTDLSGHDARDLYEILSRAGFRRSHAMAYRPACHGCAACVPVRVLARAFRPGRTFARIKRRNSDLAMEIRPAIATREQFALFSRYLDERHGEGEMAGMQFGDYRAMIEESALDSRLIEFREAAGRLLAVCLADWSSDGISAVYSFFEPAEARRSLGSQVILSLIDTAALGDLAFVYLGYWVRDSRKMAYKIRFQPLEAFGLDGWKPLPAPGARHPNGTREDQATLDGQ